MKWRKKKRSCGPRAVAMALVGTVSMCSVGGRILHAFDVVELLNQHPVRLAEGNKIGCCRIVGLVEFRG